MAVQVDPMKAVLKAPGTERLKLKYDELLSSFAFKFNLRRYKEEGMTAGAGAYGEHAANWTKLIADHPTVTGVFTDSWGRAWKILLARHIIFKVMHL